MFKVSDDHQFVEDDSMKIDLGDGTGREILRCDYDHTFEHIFICRSDQILEKRAMNDLSTVLVSIQLPSCHIVSLNIFALSSDSKFYAFTMGFSAFYIHSWDTEESFELNAKKISRTAAPCFISNDLNETEFVAICGESYSGGIEIWNVKEKEMVHFIEYKENGKVSETFSANGVLFVLFKTADKVNNYLQLYDVTTWDLIYLRELEMDPMSLSMTSDGKSLVIGGEGGEKCVVLS